LTRTSGKSKIFKQGESDLSSSKSSVSVLSASKDIDEIRRKHISQERIERRRVYEEKAREILVRSIGALSYRHLDGFLDNIDSDFSEGKESKGRFGSLAGTPNRNRLHECDLEKVNELFSAVFNQEAIDKVDQLLEHLRGVGYGLVSLLLYLKNPDKYNVFLNRVTRGILAVYPEKVSVFDYAEPFSENYMAFNDAVNQMRIKYGLKPQEVDIVLTVAGTKPSQVTVAREKTTQSASIVDRDYLPPVIADIDKLASGDVALDSKYKDPEIALEEKISIAGKMLGFEVERLGQGKGVVPDAIYRAEKDRYVVLVDAKSRMDGYDLGRDYRTVMDYLERTGRAFQNKGFKVYYTIISGSFRGDPKEGIKRIEKLGVAFRMTLLDASALLRLVELKLKDPNLQLDAIENVFYEGGILRADKIEDLVKP